MTFGTWLGVELEKRGWSQRQFAKRLGMGSGTVSRWVAGGDFPQGPQIVNIARTLDVRPALVLNQFPDAPPLSDDEVFYASLPNNLTNEEKRGILAYIRGMRLPQSREPAEK